MADTTLLSRITSGVKLINLNPGEFVASIAKVRKEDVIEEEIDAEETIDVEATEVESSEE